MIRARIQSLVQRGRRLSKSQADYYRLRTEWLRFKSHLVDSVTGLPTFAAVLEQGRRAPRREGRAGRHLSGSRTLGRPRGEAGLGELRRDRAGVRRQAREPRGIGRHRRKGHRVRPHGALGSLPAPLGCPGRADVDQAAPGAGDRRAPVPGGKPPRRGPRAGDAEPDGAARALDSAGRRRCDDDEPAQRPDDQPRPGGRARTHHRRKSRQVRLPPDHPPRGSGNHRARGVDPPGGRFRVRVGRAHVLFRRVERSPGRLRALVPRDGHGRIPRA